MKLELATESGLDFKRPCMTAWRFVNAQLNDMICIRYANMHPAAIFMKDDITADDWEVKQ